MKAPVTAIGLVSNVIGSQSSSINIKKEAEREALSLGQWHWWVWDCLFEDRGSHLLGDPSGLGKPGDS